LTTLNAHVLEKPKIILGQSGETETPFYADIQDGVFKIREKVYQNITLDNWAIFYTGSNDEDFDNADDFAYELRKVGKQLGITVKRPRFIQFD